MKKIISIWLAALMLAAQPIQAAVCVGFGASSSPPTSGDIASENFNGTGTPTDFTSTGSPDYDSTTNPPVGAATGFTTEAMLTTGSWTSISAAVEDGSNYAEAYISFYLYITAEALADTQNTDLVRIDQGSDTAKSYLRLYQQTGGQLCIYVDSETSDCKNVSLNTSYLIHMKYSNTTDTLDWSVGGTAGTQVSYGSLDHQYDDIQIGNINGSNRGTTTIYFDKLEISSSAYID